MQSNANGGRSIQQCFAIIKKLDLHGTHRKLVKYGGQLWRADQGAKGVDKMVAEWWNRAEL